MPRKRPGPGRPRSKDWLETTAAADALGLTPEQLMRLRVQILKPVKHWHCKNPTAAPMGRRYLFNVRRIQPMLIPEPDPAPPSKQRGKTAKLNQGPQSSPARQIRIRARRPRHIPRIRTKLSQPQPLIDMAAFWRALKRRGG